MKARVEDLKVATRIVGSTNLEKLAWIVQFTQEDPTKWHSAERAARGDCLLALTRPVPEFIVDMRVPPALKPQEVESLHGELRAKLRELVSSEPGGPYITKPIKLEEVSTIRWVRSSSSASRRQKYGSAIPVWEGFKVFRTRLFQNLTTFIMDDGAGGRLLSCPRCGSPFVRVKKQEYCSKDCNQEERNYRRKTKGAKK